MQILLQSSVPFPLLRQKVFMKKPGILHALTMQIVHIVTRQSEIQPSIQILKTKCKNVIFVTQKTFSLSFK